MSGTEDQSRIAPLVVAALGAALLATVALDWSEPFWVGLDLREGTGLGLAEHGPDDLRAFFPAICGALGAAVAALSAVAALVTDRVRRASDVFATAASAAVAALAAVFCAWDGATAAAGAYSAAMLALMILIFEAVTFVVPTAKARSKGKESE